MHPLGDLDAILHKAGVFAARQRRQECADKGHQYKVSGKHNPSRLACGRCGVSWAVGARTEPNT